MPIIWRISNYADLDGIGGLKAGQRWHTRGRRIIYCAPSPAAAILETLAHFEIDSIDNLPSGYQLLKIDLPDTVSHAKVALRDLPENWMELGQIAETRKKGDEWLAQATHPALDVPSVVAPETWNTLLNPVLLPGTGTRIVGAVRHPFDPRLFKVIS